MTAIPPAMPPANVAATARRGLERAERKLEEAAGQIAAFGTSPAPQQDVPAPPMEAAPQPAAPQQPGTMPASGDLARPMLDLLVAQRAYQANAAVLRTDQEMRGSLPLALRV